jgi:Zn-dependent protease with chaperone function
VARYEVREDKREPLWDRVDRSRIQLVVFVTLFLCALVLAIDIVVAVGMGTFFLADIQLGAELIREFWSFIGWTSLISFSLGAIYVTWALLRSKNWVMNALQATLVPTGEMLSTKYALKDMAIASGFEVAPALHVIETSNVNAFVFGQTGKRAVVGVTQGFVDRLSIDQQRAVFANLMARLKAGDTIWATGVTALMNPFWHVDDAMMRESHKSLTPQFDGDRSAVWMNAGARQGRSMTFSVGAGSSGSSGSGFLWLFGVSLAFVAVSEFVAFGHRRTHLRHAELADAEGMLLLKDPRNMLSALEKAVRCNNFVPTAGPGFAQLFFCWSGDGSTDDENDPENRRITRLREVLGAEGMEPPIVEPNQPYLAPVAPRLDS